MEESRQTSLDHLLRCRPVLMPRIWGGRKLKTILGKDLPPDEPIGEAWEVADVPEGVSEIAGGPLAGMSLRRVMERFGDQICPREFEQFPLLVKFLDARDDISIQVHPGADVCERLFPSERSKNETWVVIEVEPGAAVLHGLRRGVSFDEVRGRIREGSIMEVMRRLEVRPGDVIHLPAGTLHALLGGIMLLEVQDPSDSTFRVYDHDRVTPEGKPRELHVEQALATLSIGSDRPARIVARPQRHDWGTRELLVDIESYRVERLTLSGEMAWPARCGIPGVVVVMSGDVIGRWDGGEEAFGFGETFIAPPAVRNLTLAPLKDRCEVVVTTPAVG